jgi:hypothetical protein
MILFHYTVLWSLFWNIKQFTLIENITEELMEEYFPLILSVNFGSLVAGAIGYGHPYLPAVLSLTGISAQVEPARS